MKPGRWASCGIVSCSICTAVSISIIFCRGSCISACSKSCWAPFKLRHTGVVRNAAPDAASDDLQSQQCVVIRQQKASLPQQWTHCATTKATYCWSLAQGTVPQSGRSSMGLQLCLPGPIIETSARPFSTEQGDNPIPCCRI